MAANDYPLAKKGKVIGEPYQGTHAKSFNQKGGSDNWQSENAVDIAVPVGTPVYAVSDGVIGSRIGSLGSGGRFAGLRVYVNTADNSYYYAHLSKLAVKAGQKVTAGQLIGYSGSANGVSHLHFAAKTGNPNDVLSGSVSTGGSSTPVQDSSASTVSVVPPVAIPSPSDTMIGGSNLQMPGSVDYQIDPSHVTSLWQMAAGSELVSPETQQMLSNAQLAAGSV